MRKQEQENINNECLKAIEKFNTLNDKEYFNRQRLDYCSAYTYETENYIVLISYHTLIAFIEKSTHTLYDVLRYVYGYTATSAKHISKFRRFNKIGAWEYGRELTYRPI